MNDALKKDLQSEIRNCGEALCRGEFKDAAPLRVLQKRLQARLQSFPPENRTLTFMLLLWIEKYYFHLSGGFASSISDRVSQIRNELLAKKVGPIMLALADVPDGPSAEAMRLYGQLVDAWLEALVSLSDLARA